MKKNLFLLFIILLVNNNSSFSKNQLVEKSKPDTFPQKNTTVTTNDSTRAVYMYIPNDSPKKVITMKPEPNNFTYIFPIITLVIGILLNKGWDYFSARSKSDKIGERWIAELRFLETPMTQQIEALETYLQNQTEETFEIQPFAVYSSLDCSIFKTLDKSELLRYLELKKDNYQNAVKASNSTHGYINILTHTHEALRDKFDAYLKATSEYTTSFSKNLNALRAAYADYGVEIEKGSGGQNPIAIHPEFAQLSQLMVTHIFSKMKNGNYNPFKMETDFFEPLQMLLSGLRLDVNAKPLIVLAAACTTDIAGLRMERRYLRINLTTISVKYKKSLEELNGTVANLENKSKK